MYVLNRIEDFSFSYEVRS